MIKTYRNTTKILPTEVPEKFEVPREPEITGRISISSTLGSPLNPESPPPFTTFVPPEKSCFLAESPFSSVEAQPVENVPHRNDTKLLILHSVIRQCADPQVRLVERVEANALCQQIRQANPGFLLEQVSERIQTPSQVIQRELLNLQKQPALKIDPFLTQLRTSRLGDYQELLALDGIFPLMRTDRLLTVLAELPCLGDLVLQRCRENHLPIVWCHVVTIKIRDLIAYLPSAD